MALLGASLFAFGLILWSNSAVNMQQTVVVDEEPETIEEVSEKERILMELSTSSSVPEEEKEQLLESLKR